MNKKKIILTQDVGHLVLEILSSDQGIEQLLSTFDHGVNFTTATSKIWVVVEGVPKIEDGFVPWLRSSIDENTDFGL
jgi:hypothetical protein